MSHISGGVIQKGIRTFALLDEIITVLGSTKLTFLPFIQATGTDVFPYGTGNDAPVATASAAVESVFDPFQHVGGVYSYYNDSSASNNIQFADDADQSFVGSGGMSVGGWFMLQEAVGTARTLLSKWDATGATEVREWDFSLDTSGQLELSLYDESANASEIGTGATAITPFIWQFLVATYDGTAATPAVHLYIGDTDSLSAGTTTESGSFVDMEDTATPAAVGARIYAGSVEQEFEGRYALSFMTGKELTSANVTTLFGIGKTLLGL